MKRLLTLVAAIALVLATAAPSLAHDDHYSEILESDGSQGSGYNRYIPVCLHSNFDGTGGWDLAYGPHAALNAAMGQWNSIGGELFFYRTDSDCDWLSTNHDDPFVQVGYSGVDIGDPMQVRLKTWYSSMIPAGYHTGPYVEDIFGNGSNIIPIWINDIGTASPFYWGTGTLPSGYYDGWTMLEHELGHVVGINHTEAISACGEGPDVMISCFWTGQTNRPLSAHDINGYIKWYGIVH